LNNSRVLSSPPTFCARQYSLRTFDVWHYFINAPSRHTHRYPDTSANLGQRGQSLTMVKIRGFGYSFGSSAKEPEEVHVPSRPKVQESGVAVAPNLSCHPFVSQDGLLVRVEPPQKPNNPELEHVPCDIVLVIDVSGSMIDEAPVPTNPGEKAEKFGLCVLDLVKHASRAILETLNEGDRLGIVTFSTQAQVRHCQSPKW
jgi:hypothetical protein